MGGVQKIKAIQLIIVVFLLGLSFIFGSRYAPLSVPQSTTTLDKVSVAYLPRTTIAVVSYSSLMADISEQSQQVTFLTRVPTVITTVAKSGSMRPILESGNVIVLTKEPVAIGDIAVYRAKDNADVIHRIVGEKDGKWIFRGDSNYFPDVLVEKRMVTWRLKAIIY